MSLDNPKKLYQNPCKTIGSGKCREYSNGIDLGGMTLRRCRRTSHELVPVFSPTGGTFIPRSLGQLH